MQTELSNLRTEVRNTKLNFIIQRTTNKNLYYMLGNYQLEQQQRRKNRMYYKLPTKSSC